MNRTYGPGPGPGPGPEKPGSRHDPGQTPRTVHNVVGSLRKHWLLTLVGLLVVLVLAVRFLRRPAAAEDEAAPAVVSAQTAIARVGDFAVTVEALGTVQPRAGSFAQVAAPAASRVALNGQSTPLW